MDVLSASAHRGLAATDAERVRRALASSLADNTRRACQGHWRERDLRAGRVERIRDAWPLRAGPGPHTVHADIAAATSVVVVASAAKNDQAFNSRNAPGLRSSIMSRIGTVSAAAHGACWARRC